jgi:outer membrane lipoprotein LolB
VITRRAAARHAAVLTIAAWALLMVGCASMAPPMPPGLIAGRLGLQVAAHGAAPARQLSGSFELRGDAAHGQLDLVSPIGVTVAQARWRPGLVELISSEGPIVFTSLDDLSARTFGEPLPLAALFDWLRGRPWGGAPAHPAPVGFEQLGWEIDTTRLAEGQLVARRAAAPAVTLRARLEPST